MSAAVNLPEMLGFVSEVLEGVQKVLSDEIVRRRSGALA